MGNGGYDWFVVVGRLAVGLGVVIKKLQIFGDVGAVFHPIEENGLALTIAETETHLEVMGAFKHVADGGVTKVDEESVVANALSVGWVQVSGNGVHCCCCVVLKKDGSGNTVMQVLFTVR